MKKIFKFFILIISLFALQASMVSCDKEEDIYYAGESEADYKPATYTITSEWDFSKVSGLSSDEKKALETAMNNSVTASEVFDTRKDAEAAFNEIVIEWQHDPDMALYKGLKAKLYLKRGSAIIKSASLEW